MGRVPAHVAIIMDGNGRWASARGLSRGEGHKAGIKAVREAITTCNDLGVKVLTIYSFSTENWKRPVSEVKGLMELFAKTMGAEVDGLDAEGVRVKLLGDIDALPLATRTVFRQAEKRTAKNGGLVLAIAVNYGARAEIAAAASKLAAEAAAGQIEPADIDEAKFDAELYTAGQPPVDLLIRTSGEQRLSNFLPWQTVYAEMVFDKTYWPDFDRAAYLRALREFAGRSRRFGGV